MFQLTRPTASAVEQSIADANRRENPRPYLALCTGLSKDTKVPWGFSLDHSLSCLGRGESVFQAAKQAMREWTEFDLGWVRVANPDAVIETGQIVAVEVRALGLWSLNLSRISDTIDTPTRFGFLYSTTGTHVERGDERFWLEYDRSNDEVRYEIEALSRPHSALALLGFPVTRRFQRKFALESHSRMRAEVHEIMTPSRRSGP